jgi:predicted GIY-YIG superfamily endonuclease
MLNNKRLRDAIAREKKIKGWRGAEKKNALVERMNAKWADLSPMLFQHTREVRRAARDDPFTT